jgi:hypothetical protein
MRKLVLLIVTIMIVAAFAGCFGGEEKKKDTEPTLVEKKGTILPMQGWAESNWESQNNEPWIVDIILSIPLNNTNIVKIKISIKVEDSDTEHAESDQGSTPDQVTAIATGGGNFTSDEEKGTTTTTLTIDIIAPQNEEEVVYLDSSWDVNLKAECYGGKPFKWRGIVPIPGSTYKDQGIYYTVTGEYSYMEVEAEG